MDENAKPLILSVDDDLDLRTLIEVLLKKSGYGVMTAADGKDALELLKKTKPDLILLDVMMAQMSGHEVCSELQKNEDLAQIPIIFVSALGEERDKAKAFAVGAVDYLVKPIRKEALLEKVRLHLATNAQWAQLRAATVSWTDHLMPFDFNGFREFLLDQFGVHPEERNRVSKVPPAEVYSISSSLGIENRQMAQYIARFLKLSYLEYINPEDIRLGVLPAPFCRHNLVVPINDVSGENAFVLSNPFNWELLDILRKFLGVGKTSTLFIGAPDYIAGLFQEEVRLGTAKPAVTAPGVERMTKGVVRMSKFELEKQPVLHIANHILEIAVADRASDIHLEPKETHTVVRCRVDGDLRECLSLKKNTGLMVMSRFKALGGLDIAERRKPQDGAVEAIIAGRAFKLRMATTSTPDGESMVIRLLEPGAKTKDLKELGMTDEQAGVMANFAGRTQGLFLVVGPTGSGKTTTLYSFLSNIDIRSRSLMSVEDPVEYRIPFANQQQVNEKAGISFESLLKSSVRQDPDILFLGEVRDRHSAELAMNFASTGHLVVTTVHTSNATTAIFRLERLGIERGSMADIIVGVVAQRLLKKLCSYCKQIVDISQEERKMLGSYVEDVPHQVAHPVGCQKCGHTGYQGREGIYEIIAFDPEVAERIRSGMPISEIRRFVRERGDYLISHHAVDKVKALICSPKEVYEKVLVEETKWGLENQKAKAPGPSMPEKRNGNKRSILFVEDDKDTQALIQLLLENRGCEVTLAGDGIDALLCLAKKDFDLILSDISMPNLDGFKLLEMKTQKGIQTPVIFLTGSGSEEAEMKAFELGARDYIKKPVQKEILWLRVQSLLERRN